MKIIIYLFIPLLLIFITSCNHQTKKLQKQTEKTSPVYPVKKEQIKQDTDVDYDKPAPPLTPEERQRLIDSTEKEDKEDKK